MKKLLLSITLICAITFSGQAQGLKNLAYGSIITGTSTYNASLECSYSDNSGNIFLAGASKAGTADFDVFSPGTSYGTSGLYFYFNKFDAAGVLQFSKLLTTTSTSTSPYVGVRGVVTDATGNIYITGTLDATVDFDPSGVTYNLSSATGKTFLAKYDSNGNFLWARNFGGVTSSNGNTILPEDIAINPTSGKIFIAGWYISGSVNGTYVDFDPSATNTATIGYSSAKCGFFAAYNPADGSYVANSQWGAISSAPTVANVEVKSVQFDNANNIYAVGQFQNTFTTTGGLTFTNTTPTGFLVKKPATTAGNATDATGTTFGIAIYDIDLDASNNVYIGGNFGPAVSGNGMVVKYNSSLVQSWAKYPTGVINSLTVNSSNQIIAVGNDWSDNFVQIYNSTGTTNFGANGLHILISSGYQQQFIKEVQVVGSNLLIGGDFYTTNASLANQDIGYNNETILVNNPTSYKNQFWGIYSPDFFGPIATITTTATDPTTVSPIPLTITFDEEAYLFDATAFGTNNGTISNLVQTGTLTYTADLIPTTAGLTECEIFGAMFYDNQNNPNQGSNYFSITYNLADAIPPTVTISSTSSDPTNVSPIPVTFTFSETVTGFTIADISVTNGTAGNFVALSGTVYTADITPTTQGLVSINVLANVCIDGASNQNTASNTLTRTFDSANPSVTISSTSSDPTNVSPIPVTFTFSETITGFILADISVTNGTAGNFIALSGMIYTADITPTTQGLVSINVLANVCIDGASNQNTASNTLTRTFDSANPSVTISSTSSDPTNVSPIPVTFTFSETVTGFTIADISVTNGTAGNFVALSGTVYTADITPTTQGLVSINVLANMCIDGASNQNTASNTLTPTFDSANPSVTISSTSSDPTNVSPIPVTFTFSETVTGFTIADISVTNGTAGNFVALSGTVYTADITPTSQGVVSINVLANMCADGASNQNTASSSFTRTFDNVAPTVVISTTASDPTAISPIPVTITFSETVTGFTISDLIIGNGTASNFIAVSGIIYTVDIIPTAQGMVTVDINSATCSDNATNQNISASPFSILYQLTTGITTNTDSKEINVYPNPSSERITINCKQEGNLEVFNLLGEKVFEKKIEAIETSLAIVIETEGTYICIFSSNNKSYYSKFIIVK